MSSLGGPPCCGCDSGGTYQRGGGGGCGGGVINWAYSVLWGSKGSGVRGGSRAMSRDGGHGKGVGPGGWGGCVHDCGGELCSLLGIEGVGLS